MALFGGVSFSYGEEIVVKSTVQSYVFYQEIPMPEHYLRIEIPSWELVTQPVMDQALIQYRQLSGDEDVFELNDERVHLLQLPGVESLKDLQDYARRVFKENQIDRKFYQEIMAYLLAFYVETSQTIINRAELTEFREAYLERFGNEARQADMTFEEYGRQLLQTEADPHQLVKEHAKEEFVFRLIAQDVFKKQGKTITEDDYENFVQQSVLHQGADEIEVRDQMSYQQYQEMLPEMLFTQELYQYFKPQITFKPAGDFDE